MTPILGQTEDGVKTTQRTMKVLPEVVIYDVDLTLTLPIALSVTSGINAMAHAIEALYAENRNPVISMLAEEGIRALYRTLGIISDKPSDIKVRSDALFGAWLCGTSLGSVGMALHHKLCHTLGGTFDLPHSETHTVLLPHVTAFNAVAVPELDALGHKLNGTSLAVSIAELAKRAGAPLSLAAIGMPKDGLDRAAKLAVSNPYFNPRKFNQGDIRELLENAFHGTPLEQ
jgi:alcohol dehydrogenase class IV